MIYIDIYNPFWRYTMDVMRKFFKHRFEISDQRMAICRQCDKFDPKSSQCSECGCFMEYKTLLPYVDCPLGKWKAFTAEEDK